MVELVETLGPEGSRLRLQSVFRGGPALGEGGQSDHVSGEEQRRVSIDWVQLVAGALTAVTSAVLLSTVGVAGTLIGAAVGSVVATVGNSVYSHYLALSKERVAAAKALAEARAREASQKAARARMRAAAGGHLEDQQRRQAEEDLREAQADVAAPEERARPSWREAMAGLPWKRILAVAAAVFVLAMGAILAFEGITGRAVSTFTGGSDDSTRISIPGVGGGRSDEQGPRQGPGPQETEDPTGEPSGESEPPPTSTVSPSPTVSTEPEPTPSPTESPTPTPLNPQQTGPPAPAPAEESP